MKSHIAKLIATFFYTGLCPIAPGTAGSLAAVIIILPLLPVISHITLLLLIPITYIIGVWSANVFMNDVGEHDPGAIVIDEVLGVLITTYIVDSQIQLDTPTHYWVSAAVIFFLFRFFDIVKPWPIRWLDKNIKGGTGVMVDDVLAGIFAGFFSYFLLYLIFNTSY